MRNSILFLALAAFAACSRPEAPKPPAAKPASAMTPARVTIGETTVSLPRQVGECRIADGFLFAPVAFLREGGSRSGKSKERAPA